MYLSRIEIIKHPLSMSIDAPNSDKIGLQFLTKNIHELVNPGDFIHLIEGVCKNNHLIVAVLQLAMRKRWKLDYFPADASNFGSGHDLILCEFEPCVGLCAGS